jgi:hypothetical protein
MTTITVDEYETLEGALDGVCSSCVGCPFDDDVDCRVITIKSLLREHVKEDL